MKRIDPGSDDLNLFLSLSCVHSYRYLSHLLYLSIYLVHSIYISACLSMSLFLSPSQVHVHDLRMYLDAREEEKEAARRPLERRRGAGGAFGSGTGTTF